MCIHAHAYDWLIDWYTTTTSCLSALPFILSFSFAISCQLISCLPAELRKYQIDRFTVLLLYSWHFFSEDFYFIGKKVCEAEDCLYCILPAVHRATKGRIEIIQLSTAACLWGQEVTQFIPLCWSCTMIHSLLTCLEICAVNRNKRGGKCCVQKVNWARRGGQRRGTPAS